MAAVAAAGAAAAAIEPAGLQAACNGGLRRMHAGESHSMRLSAMCIV
jgi:hypothetical protein